MTPMHSSSLYHVHINGRNPRPRATHSLSSTNQGLNFSFPISIRTKLSVIAIATKGDSCRTKTHQPEHSGYKQWLTYVPEWTLKTLAVKYVVPHIVPRSFRPLKSGSLMAVLSGSIGHVQTLEVEEHQGIEAAKRTESDTDQKCHQTTWLESRNRGASRFQHRVNCLWRPIALSR